MQSFDLNVIGLGYVGLPTALLAACAGLKVHGVDTNHYLLTSLRDGQVGSREPGLKVLLRNAIESGSLLFGTDTLAASVHIIAVPTPVTVKRTVDLTYVQAALTGVIPKLRPKDLLVIESTVSPGCIDEVVAPILREAGYACGRDIYLTYCPERVLPGHAIEEIVNNERIIGGFTPECAEMARTFYSRFIKGRLHLTSHRMAEMVKLFENSYRDVNIAFANELANICTAMKLDPWEAIDLANRHPRVNILNPGPGVGGHCIAVDPWFVIERCPNQSPLLLAARRVNDARPSHIVAQIKELVCDLTDPKVAVWGVTYKPNVCDCRESPSLQIIKELRASFRVSAADPMAGGNCPIPLEALADAVTDADLLVILVGHDQFDEILIDEAISKMRSKRVLDLRPRRVDKVSLAIK